MSSRTLRWASDAREDYSLFVKNDPKIAKRIVAVINDILKTPAQGIGKPEQLKNSLSGYWSRRITEEHRLVYRIDESEISIVQVRYHY